MKRRGALFGASALALLTGCSSGQNTDYALYFKALRQSVPGMFFPSKVTRDQAASIPFASMGYRVDGGAENFLVLATDTNGSQLWTSQSHVVIVTQDGRIARTVGLAQDLGGSAPLGASALPPPAAAFHGSYASSRSEDFPDIGVYADELTCRTSVKGPESIVIIGQALSVMRIDETCTDQSRNRTFTDNYWADPDSGFVWRSRQHVGLKGAVIDIEIFRPPG